MTKSKLRTDEMTYRVAYTRLKLSQRDDKERNNQLLKEMKRVSFNFYVGEIQSREPRESRAKGRFLHADSGSTERHQIAEDALQCLTK